MPPEINTPPDPQTPLPADNGRKILLIEDETFISDLYVRALSKAGYMPTVIVDGQQALNEAKTNNYDIILLDIMVPNLMGTDILSQINSLPEPLKAKIIVTTNLELKKEDRAPLEAKVDGYLIKADITPRELVAFLDHLQLS